MPALTVDDFDFPLPPELIAQHPAPERNGSRLLHVCGKQLFDRQFTDLPSQLRAGDLLVFNDTRVIKARFFGQKDTGGQVEVLLERIVDSTEPEHPVEIQPGEEVELELCYENTAPEKLLYLADTDWYVVREQETGKPMPDEVRARRSAIRVSL